MGADESKVLTTDVMVQEVKSILSSLKEKDNNLFRFAVCKIAEETKSLENVEVFLHFAEHEPVTVRAKGVKKPSGRIYVGFDEKGNCKYIWENESFARKATHFFVDSIRKLIEMIRDKVIDKGVSAGIDYALKKSIKA